MLIKYNQDGSLNYIDGSNIFRKSNKVNNVDMSINLPLDSVVLISLVQDDGTQVPAKQCLPEQLEDGSYIWRYSLEEYDLRLDGGLKISYEINYVNSGNSLTTEIVEAIVQNSNANGVEPVEPSATEEIFENIAKLAAAKQDKFDYNIKVIGGNNTVVDSLNTLDSNKQNKTDNDLTTQSKDIVGSINELNSEKQNKVDDTLVSETKNVVQAINNNTNNVSLLKQQVTTNTQNISQSTDTIEILNTKVETIENEIGDVTLLPDEKNISIAIRDNTNNIAINTENIALKLDKSSIDEDYMNNLTFSLNGDTAVSTITIKNPVSGNTSDFEVSVINAASISNTGLMTSEMVQSLIKVISDVESLKYEGRQLKAFPTYADAQVFDWDNIEGPININDYFIVEVDESRPPSENNPTTQYICTSTESPITTEKNFEFHTIVTSIYIQIATESTLGGILSTNVNGYIYVEPDGKCKLVGYDAIITSINNLTQELISETARAKNAEQLNENAISVETIRATEVEKTITTNIENIVTNKTPISNNDGGFSAGQNANVGIGGAIGNNANATTGGSMGFIAKTSTGAAIGAQSLSENGGAVGAGATTVNGGAVGRGAKSDNGFAGGANAKTVDSQNNTIDAVQLGTGINNISRSLQIYDDNIYNANTHSLTVTNIETQKIIEDGIDINKKYAQMNQIPTNNSQLVNGMNYEIGFTTFCDKMPLTFEEENELTEGMFFDAGYKYQYIFTPESPITTPQELFIVNIILTSGTGSLFDPILYHMYTTGLYTAEAGQKMPIKGLWNDAGKKFGDCLFAPNLSFNSQMVSIQFFSTVLGLVGTHSNYKLTLKYKNMN